MHNMRDVEAMFRRGAWDRAAVGTDPHDGSPVFAVEYDGKCRVYEQSTGNRYYHGYIGRFEDFVQVYNRVGYYTIVGENDGRFFMDMEEKAFRYPTASEIATELSAICDRVTIYETILTDGAPIMRPVLKVLNP